MSTETSRNASNNAESSLPCPPALWAQRNDKIIFTIRLEDCQNPHVDITETTMHFRGKGGHDAKDYEMKVDFYGDINPQESKQHLSARELLFNFKKKESGPYWPRLLKAKSKPLGRTPNELSFHQERQKENLFLIRPHWLKTDFNKWKDEDDSESDAGEDTKLEDMMNAMGGLGQGDLASGEQADEEDSDDEELPDLEA